MAQRTEKEETEFKVVPETITPCVNNCGVTGNPATNNMCQKCFNSSTAATAANTTIATSTTSSSISGGSGTETKFFGEKSPRSAPSASLEYDKDQKTPDRVVSASQPDESTSAAKREVNRCSGCRKRVGLTGFRCRCGELFCAEHRYTDRHDCSYDYRAAGREAIARENPVVKAAKIVKV